MCIALTKDDAVKDFRAMRRSTVSVAAKDPETEMLSRLDDAMADLEMSTSNFFWTLLYCSMRTEWMMSTTLGAHFHLLSAMQLVADSREELGELPRKSVLSCVRS